MYRPIRYGCAMLFGILWVGCGLGFADVGLIVEGPTGPLGFFSDVGHASVWISHGCLDEQGQIQYCEQSRGIVLTSTSYWPNPGVAAIPAELFFLGSAVGQTQKVRVTWGESLASAYPEVPEAYGRKYLGRVWRRQTNVLVFPTSAEEDRRVLETLQQKRMDYHYDYLRRNCADYAELVLRLYLGDHFKVRHWLDFGVTTPRALQRALVQLMDEEPHGDLRRYHFAGLKRHGWRQPPRNICESAVLDPKYAVPLVFFHPIVYAGFGVCYGVTRLAGSRHQRRSVEAEEVGRTETDMSQTAKKLATFTAMTDSNAGMIVAAAGESEITGNRSGGLDRPASKGDFIDRNGMADTEF